MVHESKLAHQISDVRRRPMASSAVLRKVSGPEPSHAFAVRQRVGNQGIQRLMSESVGHSNGIAQTSTSAIQTKLTVSQPGDAHEQEADRIANDVMRMPDSSVQETTALASAGSPNQIQRKCTECDEELEKKSGPRVQRKEQTADALPVTPAVAANIQSLRGGGRELPASTRAFFEPRFGADFSGVRVHTDERASAAAKSISAKAFTLGNNIAFASGQYAPHSHAGQRLLAHELTHTIQQRTGVVSPSTIQREPAGGCGLCYGDRTYKVGGARNAGIAVHKAIQNQLAPKGGVIEAELAWGKGRVDLAIVRPITKEVAIAEIKPANEKGLDDGIAQIEERLRVLPKLKPYNKYKWVKLDKPVVDKIRFPTDAPVCMPPYAAQPGYCFSQDLWVAGPVDGLLYLYFCKPSYSELLATGCSCECKEPKDKKPDDKQPKDKKPGPSDDSFPEQLYKLGKELAPWLVRAGLFDIGMALARVMLSFIAGPFAALAAVILAIAFYWDEIKSLASKIAGVAQAVWDRIVGLAELVRGGLTTILGKLSELGIKLAELGSFLARTIASFVKKLAEGAAWVAGKIARKIASGAKAFWDWLWGSDVEPMYPVIDIPSKEETTKCATVAQGDTIIKLDTDLLFPYKEWVLKPEADALLKDAAKKIASMLRKDDWIRFEGYTDIIGSSAFNQPLSERRAEAVRSWFVAHGVVPMSRTRIEGYGKKMARAKANDVEGRKKDRRVDIWLPKSGGTRKVCWF